MGSFRSEGRGDVMSDASAVESAFNQAILNFLFSFSLNLWLSNLSFFFWVMYVS